MAESHTKMYPTLEIKNNEHPSRLFSIPFIGLIIKVILIIPVAIVSIFYSLWYFILWIAAPFAILFTGKIPDSIYEYFLNYMRFYIKLSLYLMNLTDKYPGFGLDDNGVFKLHFEKPKKPSRLLAFPLLGIFIRCILLVPYFIYEYVLQYGSQWSVFFSWFAVLFKGKYPESLYEFNRDFLRVATAETLYTSYLSDDYPSFQISMKHKKIKILLIVLGALSLINYTFTRSQDMTQIDTSSYNQDTNYEELQNPIEDSTGY